MNDGIKISGRLRLWIGDELVADAPNQVTFLGSEALMRGWLGSAGYNLTTFEAGTGTGAPSTGDTALGTSVYGPAAITSAAVTGSLAMDITFDIPPGLGAMNLTEFGLFCSNGDLFSRWCDGNTYVYTGAFTLHGIWTITLAM